MKKEERKGGQIKEKETNGPFMYLSIFFENYCVSAVSLGCE